MLRQSRTLTIAIARPPEVVYAFVSAPANLPQWATAACRSISREGERWVMETPAGRVSIRFVEPNPFGVLDHVVTISPAAQILVPMRVVPNGSGSEVIFTLFREDSMSEEMFARDLAMVEQDLRTLKAVLEQTRTPA